MDNYHQYLTNMGYLLKKDQLTNEQIKNIKQELTFTPLVCQALKSINRPNSFVTYKESPRYLFLPRFYGLEKFGNPIKTILSKGNYMKDECQIIETYNIRPHQENAYNKTQQQLLNKGGGILSVFCGWGKTFMAIYLAVKLHVKTLVLIHKDDLVNQWKDEINCFTGGKASIGIIQRDKIDVDDHDFVLAMIPSMAQRNYSSEIFKSFQLLIVDECHHVGSEVFSRVLDKTAFRYTLGLSATPYRKDGLTTVFTNYLGPIFHIEKRSGRSDTLAIRIPLTSHSDYYSEQYFVNGTRNTAKMVVQLTEFYHRNRMIIEIVKHLISEQNSPELRKILILSNSRGHLTTLYQLLKDLKLTRNGQMVTFGYYWGLTNNGETGLQEKCQAPIPEIVKIKNRLNFKIDKQQPCIFYQQPNSKYCLFHQYLNSDKSNNQNQYQLCQNIQIQCYNYFFANNESKLCPVCSSNTSSSEPNNLLELIKSANKTRSTKTRYKEMLNTSKQCDIILGTNGIASEALNIPGLNTLIQATPQQAVEQTVGRILRKQSIDSNNPPLIIDLIDHCGNFVNHSRVRLKTYKTEGFRQKLLPKLNMDDNPLDKFCWQYFDQLVKEHSFGLNNESNQDESDDEQEQESINEQCIL